MSVFCFRFALMTLVMGALVLQGCAEKETQGTPKTPTGEAVSFTRDIKPILDTKCVNCHACYDAPGALDLRSVKGIVRGAMKTDTYGSRLTAIEPTFVWNSPNTLDDWRKMGFVSVIEGGRDSIMGKLLALGHANPVKPNGRFPDDIEIDQLTRKNYLPNKYEIDGYVEQFPQQGMPLAVSGLTDKEYEAMMSWLEAGAPIDYEAPKATAEELARIAKWEQFLNGDKRSRLVGRYFFEHLSYITFVFADRDADRDDDDARRFIIVRSTTPSGKDPVPVYEHVANKPVDGAFYYRFLLLDQTPVVKMMRIELLASDAKLERFRKIFYEEDWSVDQLPGYTEAERYSPLTTFRAIPAKARWKFNLANAEFHRGQITYTPVCHGGIATDAVLDIGWDIYESDETSLYVNDAQYRAEVDPLLEEITHPGNLLGAIQVRQKWVEKHNEATKRGLARAKELGYRSNFTDIWRGEYPDDKPLTNFFRHDDNAYAQEGKRIVGHFPKAINLWDLPNYEASLYAPVVNFNVFGPTMEQVEGARTQYGLTRVYAEANFLRFLPREVRLPLWKSWYQGQMSEERWKLMRPNIPPDDAIPTDIKYSTDDPQREFYERLLEYYGPFVDANDPINRPKPGDNPDRITKAFISIVAASTEGHRRLLTDKQEPWRKFKTFLPEAVFLRIDKSGQEPAIYTMTHDRYYATKSFFTPVLDDEIPANATVSIMQGALTAYPNYMFVINEDEIQEFASTLIDADTQKKFTAVVERWGIRRSSPDFWPVLNSVTAYVKRTNPTGAPNRPGGTAATFDINRYKNL